MKILRRAANHAAAPWLGLLVVTSLVWGNTLANGFVWDDEEIIVQNPVTRDLSRLGEVLLSPDKLPPYYRPLNRASYLVDYALFGMDPRPFHAVNVLLHAASVLLLFALGRRLFDGRWPALLAAGLLAIHPIHAEAVNFVTARNNLFALAFALATLILFVDATRRASRGRAWLSGAAFFLGLASKEQAAMVLPVAAAWLFLPGTGAIQRGWRAWRALVPHAVALAAYAVCRSIALGAPVAAGEVADGLFARLTQNVWTLPRYFALVVWPDRLTIFHAPMTRAGLVEIVGVALAWVAMMAAVLLVVRRPSLPAAVGLTWLAANFLPIANVVPLPSTTPLAERFFHAPAVGIWLLVAAGADHLSRTSQRRSRVAAVAATAALVALASRTYARNLDWRDDMTLARSAVATDSRSARAWHNLGVSLWHAGDPEGATHAWRKALGLDPNYAQALMQLGTVAAMRGDHVEGERLLLRAIELDPENATAHLNLARLYDRTDRPHEALPHYVAGLELLAPDRRDPRIVERVRELRR